MGKAPAFFASGFLALAVLLRPPALAAARLRLPGPWSAFYDWKSKTLDDAEDLRDLALECEGFRLRLGLGFFSEGVHRVLTPHIKMEDLAVANPLRARDAERAQRSAAKE